MLKQYYSQDKSSGYIRYYQIYTQDIIRLTPTLWGLFGYAYSQGTLFSQFRVEFKWNSFIPIQFFDELSSRLNYVFENENNSDDNYRIIVNTLRVLFDDWWLEYDKISQRPPAPLFIKKSDPESNPFYNRETDYEEGISDGTILENSPNYITYNDYIEIDSLSNSIFDEDKNTYIYVDETIDKYIRKDYRTVPFVDKNGSVCSRLINKDVKRLCFYAFLKGIILQQYSNELVSEYNEKGGITVRFNGKLFAIMFNELLNQYKFKTEFNKHINASTIFIYEDSYSTLSNCLDVSLGFCNEPEPPIFISSPSRDIREPLE